MSTTTVAEGLEDPAGDEVRERGEAADVGLERETDGIVWCGIVSLG